MSFWLCDIYKTYIFHGLAALCVSVPDRIVPSKTRYVKGLVKEIIHDPGRGAPLAKAAQLAP